MPSTSRRKTKPQTAPVVNYDAVTEGADKAIYKVIVLVGERVIEFIASDVVVSYDQYSSLEKFTYNALSQQKPMYINLGAITCIITESLESKVK